MDGLECKEVCKSELERTLRIDSEFYSKNYVEIYNMLSSLAHKPLTAYVDVSDGNHMGISEHFSDEGMTNLFQNMVWLPSPTREA